jgi:hypothetical protein
MPVHRGIDSKGSYYRWGKSGKKYYYKVGSSTSREKAKAKAHLQARAIYASGYRSKNRMKSI